MKTLPNIYIFLNYRQYLKDCVRILQEDQKLSARKLSKVFGFSSTSYLKAVIDGKKTLAAESARRVAHALKLSGDEIEFFAHLVQFNQAKTDKDRDHAFQRLLAYRRFAHTHKLSAQDYELWSSWYTTAILELVKTDMAYSSPSAMAESLGISQEEVERTLHLLQQLGFIEPEGNGLRQLHPARETPAEIQSLSVQKYHEKMLEKSLEALHSLSPQERSLSALTVALTDQEFEIFKRKLFETMKEINALAGNDIGDKRVYQINCQIFPLSRNIPKPTSEQNTRKRT